MNLKTQPFQDETTINSSLCLTVHLSNNVTNPDFLSLFHLPHQASPSFPYLHLFCVHQFPFSLSVSSPNSYSQATVQCIKVHVTSGVCMCWMTNALRLSDCLVCQTDAVGTMVDSCFHCLNEGDEVCGACLCHQPSSLYYMTPLKCLMLKYWWVKEDT